MSGRERIMAGVLGGAIALLGGSKLAYWAVMAPLNSLDADVAAARERKANLEEFVEQHRGVVQEWEAYTARTFSADAEGAKIEVLSYVARLLDRHGLTQERSITPGTPRKQKSGLTEVSLQVRVKGSLESIVGFMRDLRGKDWLIRLAHIDLRVEGGARERTGRRKSRGADSNVTLGVSMTATAVVVPRVPGTEHRAPSGGVPALPRLAREAEAYDEIVSVNFFKKYVPRRPKPPPAATQQAAIEDGLPDQPITPRPEPRPDIKVVGISGLNGVPRVYVRDQDHLEEPLGVYFVNDELDDGQLVLVHPKGIVVRVTKRVGSSDETVNYFYPPGSNFKERVPLKAADADEVLRALYQEQARARARPNTPRPTE